MGWYIVIKTIKGHPYRYRQRTWREGKRVRTESIYLGRTGGDADRERSEPVNTTPRAHDVVVVDAVAETKLIERVFDASKKATTWKRPWLGGRYKGAAEWMPDRRLYVLAAKVGVVGKSSPFGGLVDFGWRKKRYEIKASYSSQNVLQIPDHTRFSSNDHATAAENFAHTLLHEIAHATGTRAECKRVIFNPFDRAGYAREELVADMAAHIMAHRLGLAPKSVANVAWYVDNWSGRLDDKQEARAYAEREALRTADYLTKLWGEIAMELTLQNSAG